MSTRPYPTANIPLRDLVSKLAHILPMVALLAGLVCFGVWAAQWSNSALLGLVAANLAFVLVAAFFPVNRTRRR